MGVWDRRQSYHMMLLLFHPLGSIHTVIITLHIRTLCNFKNVIKMVGTIEIDSGLLPAHTKDVVKFNKYCVTLMKSSLQTYM